VQDVRSGRRSTRAPRRQRAPSPVSTRHDCPVCGADHAASIHGLANVAGFLRLTRAELGGLRLQALEELPHAVRGDAGPEHLQQLAQFVAAVDARLERLHEY
jgi:hypothetical protein